MSAAPEALIFDLLDRTDHPLLKRSLAAIAGDPEAFASRFYAKVFEAKPGLRVLFPADMTQQRMKLIQTIGVVISGIDESEALVPALRKLGAAHRGYGAKTMHYQFVADAMIAALSETIGSAWSPDMERAWQRLLQWVSMHMIAGADSTIKRL